MDVIRDVLDNQLVDRNQCKMGKVDGIVMELRSGQPPLLGLHRGGCANPCPQAASTLVTLGSSILK